jgi:hypothetical protein
VVEVWVNLIHGVVQNRYCPCRGCTPTPPASACRLAAGAERELTRLLAEWKTLRDTKLKQ